MGRKGKKKPADGGGDQLTQPGSTSGDQQPAASQPQQAPAPAVAQPTTQAGGDAQPQTGQGQGQGKGKKGKKEQPSRETTPAVEQPPTQAPAPAAAQPTTQAGGDVQPQTEQGKGKGKKGKKEQPSRETTPAVEQPPTQAPAPVVAQAAGDAQPQTEQGRGKGKKGKKEQPSRETTPAVEQPSRETTPAVEQPSREIIPVVEQPPPQIQQAQPADVKGKKRKGKKPQEQSVQPAAAEPSLSFAPPQASVPPPMWVKGPTPTQQPPTQVAPARDYGPGGRGTVPPFQQQTAEQAPPVWGRGQTPQADPARGRGQTPPPAPFGRGAPQQRGAGRGGLGRGTAPYQQQALPPQQPPSQAPAWSRGQTPPQQPPPQAAPAQQMPQQPPGRGAAPPQQQRGRGRGAGPGPARRAPQALVEPMQRLQIKEQPTKEIAKQSLDLELPRRKNLRSGGTRGTPCRVETNHLALKIDPRLEIAYHFDVAIMPDKPKKMMQVVWNRFKQEYLARNAVAFDGVRNAYSPQRFNDVAGEVTAAEDEFARPKEYKVVVKYAATVNIKELFSYMQSGCVTAVPQEALQCIDIVLRDACSVRFVKVGRSFFTEPEEGRVIKLGNGLELWHGHFQSAVIGWKPFLNVDVAHKGFPTAQPVIDLFYEMTTARLERGEPLRFERDDTDKISKFMRNLKVQYEIPRIPSSRRCYRVNGLASNAQEAKFVPEGKPQMSIFDYFRTEKGYTISNPKLPCLWVGPKDRKILLPAELCTILPGQVHNRKLNEIQTSNMVRNAATSTSVRKQKIMNSLHTVRYNDNPMVRAFGLQVGTNFEQVNARWLPPPVLEYNNGRNVRPARGVWRATEFHEAAHLPQDSWTIINLDRRTKDDALNRFAQLVTRGCRELGMNIGLPKQPYIYMDRFDDRQFERILRENQTKKLLIVVIPDYPTTIYGKVKSAAEIKVGCLTQCIKARTMYRMNDATVGNILLKVNAKLKGQNHIILDSVKPPCLKRPCMIMGADVTHPSPDQTDIPSVAAVTASCDPLAFRYNFSWRLQDPRQEIIGDLQNIVKEQLLFFFQTNKGQKPEKIIFFRDGVSEGQFKEVMNMEVQAIRRACQSMPGDYQPLITFLVVQKRHHTRFFPTNPRESEDKNVNVRAGTVVDTEITHPTALEYYLVSHASIQGVARPTKYRVLWDDNNPQLGEDELEALTYYLCHMFSRCTRSVSYPAPTYYAHLAAFRVRAYLDDRRSINLDALAREQKSMEIKQEILRGLPMFFV